MKEKTQFQYADQHCLKILLPCINKPKQKRFKLCISPGQILLSAAGVIF